VEPMPLGHRIAHRLARAGWRGSSWYWRLARVLQSEPAPGVVVTPDGRPLVHDPADWICLTAYEGTYEREVLDLIQGLLGPGDVVVDVGANVGVISVHSARIVGPLGKVIAVEPSPRCLDDLRTVVAGFEQVTVVVAALGPETGSVELTSRRGAAWHRGGGTVVPGRRAGLTDNWWAGEKDGEKVVVDQRRLDEVIDEYLPDGTEIALLKVDVEGYEPEVLAGAPELLDSGRVRSAIFEVTPSLSVNWVGDLLERLDGAYEAFAIQETGRVRRRLQLLPVDSLLATERSKQWNLLLDRSRQS